MGLFNDVDYFKLPSMSKGDKQIPAQAPEKQVRDNWEKIWPKKKGDK